MTEQAIATVLAVADVTEDDLSPRNRRALDNARRDAALAADLIERYRGRRVAGTARSCVWPYEQWSYEGVVDRVFVGNPYRVPHARLTDGQIVPLPEDSTP